MDYTARALRQLAVALCLCAVATAQVPLPGAPDWTSDDADYSTGGAFADLDGDGWLDLCVSNGNDMDLDRNAAYLNRNGTLDDTSAWRSSDTGMFGHCYAGDLDNDGDFDLCVAYLGPDSGRGGLVVRAYRNESGALEPEPWWQAADEHSSFDCCLGDFDLDGDLDVAISAGDIYRNDGDSARVYRNDNGTLDSLPCWTAFDSMPSDAIRFCDIDDDGDLDLFVGQYRKVTMYENHGGTLDSLPCWTARSVGWVLRLAFGDYDRDGFPDLAVASNSQRGGINHVKVFHNDGGTLDTSAAFTMLAGETYSSCVAWGDCNGDGFPELAAGGWWEPVVVFENDSGTLDTDPSWSWQPAVQRRLVCETVLWGDVGNSRLVAATASWDGDGSRSLFSFPVVPLQFLDSVKVDGTTLPPSGWCSDPLVGWLSLAEPPAPGSDNVQAFYRHSTGNDLAVTNWDPQAPSRNHVFLNTDPSGIAGPADSPFPRLAAFPNPAAGAVRISAGPGARGVHKVAIYRQDGSLVRTVEARSGAASWLWDGRDSSGSPTSPGIYFARCAGCHPVKLVRLNGGR